MSLNFMDFGIPLLMALVKLGEKAKSVKVYPEVKKIMGINPEKFQEEGFNRIKNIQIYETGGILGVRGIVYEPINEQGAILLFAAL
jgi:hypothetical protein